MGMKLREDLMYAAFAAYHGFSIHGSVDGRPPEFVDGIPHDRLAFKRARIHVWMTERGWRVGRMNIAGTSYVGPTDADFFKSLKNALQRAIDLAPAVRRASSEAVKP